MGHTERRRWRITSVDVCLLNLVVRRRLCGSDNRGEGNLKFASQLDSA